MSRLSSERFKYCVYDSGEMRESLVDMQEDPGETTNLASLPERRQTLLEHRRYLWQWIARSGDAEATGFAFRPLDASSGDP